MIELLDTKMDSKNSFLTLSSSVGLMFQFKILVVLANLSDIIFC